MSGNKPHKAAFLSTIEESPEALHYLMGYLAGEIPDEKLCAALQSWRAHEAALADLQKPVDVETKTELYDPRD